MPGPSTDLPEFLFLFFALWASVSISFVRMGVTFWLSNWYVSVTLIDRFVPIYVSFWYVFLVLMLCFQCICYVCSNGNCLSFLNKKFGKNKNARAIKQSTAAAALVQPCLTVLLQFRRVVKSQISCFYRSPVALLINCTFYF